MLPRPKVANIKELLTPRGKSSREIQNDLVKGVAILFIVDVKPLTSILVRNVDRLPTVALYFIQTAINQDCATHMIM